MKVKMFLKIGSSVFGSFSSLEGEINQFLSENDIEIVDIRTTSADSHLCVFIFYNEK